MGSVVRLDVGDHGFKPWKCYIILLYLIIIFYHRGLGSNPGWQKLLTLLMSPKGFLFILNFFGASECDLTGSLKGYKSSKLFFSSTVLICY